MQGDPRRICGSDLHIYNAGAAFGFPPSSRLGHEFIGAVEAVGPEVAVWPAIA